MGESAKNKRSSEKRLRKTEGKTKKLIDMMAKNRAYPFCSEKGKIFFRGVRENAFAEETQDKIINYFDLQTKKDCEQLREVAKKRAEELRTSYPVKDWVESDRPREKLVSKGPKNLKDGELLAILLRTGRKGKNVIELAEQILRKYSKKRFFNMEYEDLVKVKGISKAKACTILAAQEIVKRALKVRDESLPKIKTVEDVLAQAVYMRKKEREHLMAIYLNARNEMLYKKPMFIGTLNANLVHPREIFTEALKQNAASVILAHNHPSGDPKPSEDDLEITERIVKAGKIMGIDVLDHIIITQSHSPYSFKEHNLI